MIYETHYEQQTFKEEYYEETDERCTYEHRWYDSSYYEDARFL